ncbi:MAG: hypothetical protein LLG40_13230, partial [Deltaproteobacteria bacterium]|nr:hypothetical protein [Deltaproteobacteria bacterium]
EIKAELVKQLTDLYADLSVEDKAALATYDEEFDTVSKSEAKKREIFAKKMAAFVTDAVENGNKALLSQLAPFLLANEQSATENHFKTVKSAHPDFEKYRDDGSLKNWIDTQPAYLKTVLQKVYDSGETEEVIDLYSRFKKENNIVIAGTEDTKVKDDLKKKEEDEIKKKKLQDMEGVDSGGRPIGSAGVGSKDKNDEDSAAAEAFSDK